MLEVYATQKAIETLVGSGHNNPNWDKLLRLDSCVKVYVDTDEETLNQLMLDNDIDLEADSENILEKTKGKDDAVVLFHPVSIFFPSINVQKASDIQNRYGVLCQGDSHITDDNMLSKVHKTVHLGSKSHNWKEILSSIANIPSNAILINDQYLFSRGRENADGKINFGGLANLRRILDTLLPINFDAKTSFHVTVVISEESVNYKSYVGSFEKVYLLTKISKMIKEEIRNLRRYSTPIQVEVLSVGTSTNIPDECKLVHDRYILTNYTIIDCTHAFDAFNDKGNAIYTQDVHVKSIFGEGVDDDSDIPEETAFDYRKKFYTNLFKSSLYTFNSKQIPFVGMENRLIKYIPKE